jgi:hypothetical protein
LIAQVILGKKYLSVLGIVSAYAFHNMLDGLDAEDREMMSKTYPGIGPCVLLELSDGRRIISTLSAALRDLDDVDVEIESIEQQRIEA